MLLTVVAFFAVVISYYLLISVVEWLRIRAGVASDTATPIDILAWQGCIFTACVVAGNLAYGLLRFGGVASLAVILLAPGICLVLHLSDLNGGSLIIDGLSAAFGVLTLPVLAWTVVVGLAAGWTLSTSRHKDWSAWPAVAVFVGALISLVIVFYPAERYFLSVFGGI